MKAAIYDPYLDTLGGGERYCLTVAQILLKHHWQVDLFWSGEKDLINRAQKRFSLDLNGLRLVPDVFQIKAQKIDMLENRQQIRTLISQTTTRQQNPIQKLQKFIQNYHIGKGYDLFFYLSDGSVPFLFGQNNLLHIQVPFNISLSPAQKLLNLIKFKAGKIKIVCNSRFTQKFTKKLFSQPSTILYPPVDIDKFKPAASKKNYILSVGRFDNILNAKKQDVLISAFQTLSRQNSTWQLVLAGGSTQTPGKNLYLKHLLYIAKNLPVKFVVNPPFSRLQKLYSASKIYWHAAGYQVNQDIHPEATEHFGITVVEAMASGLVPLVVNQGGLPEIINHNQNGFLWSDIKELTAKTQFLIGHPKKLAKMSQSALADCQKFSKSNFESQLLKIISSPPVVPSKLRPSPGN